MPSLPEILKTELEVKTNHFSIEKRHIKFSNGETRIYERMLGRSNGAVMMVPIIEDSIILVREYCAGTHCYELGFPKGKVDSGETLEQAANRELCEEIGYSARKLTFLRSVNSAPSFFQASMALYLAEDLVQCKLESGDEPEPLEIIKYPISNLSKLLFDSSFQEARCLVALSCAINMKGW